MPVLRPSSVVPSYLTDSNGLGYKSMSATNFVNSAMPILLNAPESSANQMSFDNSSLLFANPSYVPLYSTDSAGHYYPAQSSNQPVHYQSALANTTSTIFTGAISQPIMATVSTSQPAVYATATNQPPTMSMFSSLSQPFVSTASQSDIATPYGSHHNTAVAYDAYSAQLGVDNASIFTGYGYSNGTLPTFTDSSVNFVSDQLANVGLSEDFGFQNGQLNGVDCQQYAAEDEVAANYGGYATDARRRRFVPPGSHPNGTGNCNEAYFPRSNRRFVGYRAPSSLGGDRNRARQFDSNATSIRSVGRPSGPGPVQSTAAKKPQSAVVFSESDFPSLKDVVQTVPKTTTSSSNGKSSIKTDDIKRVEERSSAAPTLADENANERQAGSCDVVNSNGDDKSGTESDERSSPKFVLRPVEKTDANLLTQTEIDHAVDELVRRLRPAVDARCARRFEDVVPSANARFFIVKSNSEDDVYRSLKYSIWCSTPHGNARLQRAFAEQLAQARQSVAGGVDDAKALDLALREFPVLLFFSVNGSGHFCGVARMRSAVDLAARAGVWVSDRFTGRFDIEWLYVKDIPNAALRHIRVECPADVSSQSISHPAIDSSFNSSFGVGHKVAFTHQRDCTEIGRREALEALRVVHEFDSQTTIFDDAGFYEERERGAQQFDLLPANYFNSSEANGSKKSYRNAMYNSRLVANGVSAASTKANANGSHGNTADAVDNAAKVSYAKVVNGASMTQARNYANALITGPSIPCKPGDLDAAATPAAAVASK